MTATKTLRETHLPPEHDCSRHIHAIRIWYRDAYPRRRSSIIAAQLRTLAVYTDGFCSDEGAKDGEIDEGKEGLLLWFSTEEKRSTFIGRIRKYLSDVVADRLTHLEI